MFADCISAGRPRRRRRPQVTGDITIWKQHPCGLILPASHVTNQVQLDWGFIAAMTIGRGDRKYRVSTMYIEFENVADPDDVVTNPSYERDEGLEYYDDLQSLPTRDFLRVPIIQEPMLGISDGLETHFVAGETGNKLTFFTLTSGTTGVHGKTFSDSVNSKICGAALVAAPVFGDRTQDVLFSRGYLADDKQVLKDASAQVGVTWGVRFE